MNEADIEKALRRYRVSGPALSLTAKIAEPRVPRHFDHAWGAVAAAAIAAFWFAAHVTAGRPTVDPVRERDVAAVTEALGGGDNARQYAEAIVPRREAVVSPEWPAEVTW